MSLILAPQGNMPGVSMAPIVSDIRAGLRDAMEAVNKAVTSSSPKAPTRKRAPKKDASV